LASEWCRQSPLHSPFLQPTWRSNSRLSGSTSSPPALYSVVGVLLGDELENSRKQLRETLPIGRVVGPANVAALAVHIMINTALTGATYDIDGGQQLVAG
jgi:NAD(P)-dependent dehydrogenase (short-subunit alcohol dehydrogenase family)